MNIHFFILRFKHFQIGQLNEMIFIWSYFLIEQYALDLLYFMEHSTLDIIKDMHIFMQLQGNKYLYLFN